MLGKNTIQGGQGVITRVRRWRTDTLDFKMDFVLCNHDLSR